MLEVEVPDGLAAMPAGPGLAAALDALPLSVVPNDRMLEVLRAQYRQLCHEQARVAAVLVELARCDAVPAPGAVARLDRADPDAAHETRAALCWTRAAADGEHVLAESVVHAMPQVFASWLEGRIDRPRVRLFDQYLTGLTADQVAAVCAVAVPRAPGLTTGQLAALLRRMVIAVDPDAAARWYRRGVRDRTVCAYLGPDGTVTISANGLPPDQAEAACRRVQDLAAAAVRAGHPGTVGQVRCDVFLGLLDGRFHFINNDQIIAALIAEHYAGGSGAGLRPAPVDVPPADPPPAEPPPAEPPRSDPPVDRPPTDPPPAEAPPGGQAPGGQAPGGQAPGGQAPGGQAPGGQGPVDRRRGIEIRVGLGTLLGRDDHPGEIPGLGPILADQARLRVALQPRAHWRFAVTDTDGALLCEGHTRHRPTGAGRAGPPGGIVEIHLPETLLHELLADPDRAGAFAAVVTDIATQHHARDRHLVDLDAHPDDRLPRAALRRHTEIRDRTCTFAGVCRRPAHAGHQDHGHDHAHGGPSTRANLGPLCPADHALKHRAGWTVTRPEPATTIWHSPLGGHYPARGEFLQPALPEPVPQDPGHPEPTTPTPEIDGPILDRAPRRSEPPPDPARGPPDDGTPPF